MSEKLRKSGRNIVFSCEWPLNTNKTMVRACYYVNLVVVKLFLFYFRQITMTFPLIVIYGETVTMWRIIGVLFFQSFSFM